MVCQYVCPAGTGANSVGRRHTYRLLPMQAHQRPLDAFVHAIARRANVRGFIPYGATGARVPLANSTLGSGLYLDAARAASRLCHAGALQGLCSRPRPMEEW